ncbi:hypothetical protein D3C81_1804950 [compost metagenome]
MFGTAGSLGAGLDMLLDTVVRSCSLQEQLSMIVTMEDKQRRQDINVIFEQHDVPLAFS